VFRRRRQARKLRRIARLLAELETVGANERPRRKRERTVLGRAA
jgi:hypothetical protein